MTRPGSTAGPFECQYTASLATSKAQTACLRPGVSVGGDWSYIDALILRERDVTDGSAMEERIYYCQNYRNEVVALIDISGGGTQLEQGCY